MMAAAITGPRALGLLIVVSAGLGWWLAPEPGDETRLVQARRDAWQLPELTRRLDQSSATAVLIGAAFWGGVDKAVPPPEAVDPRWRIAAVYGRAAERAVLIAFSDESRLPQRLHVGDTLPSGHRIIGIGQRDLCIRIDGKTYRLGVERRDS